MNYLLLSILLHLPLVIAIVVGSYVLLKSNRVKSRGFVVAAVSYLIATILAIPLSEAVTVYFGPSIMAVSVLTLCMSFITALAFGYMFYSFQKASNS